MNYPRRHNITQETQFPAGLFMLGPCCIEAGDRVFSEGDHSRVEPGSMEFLRNDVKQDIKDCLFEPHLLPLREESAQLCYDVDVTLLKIIKGTDVNVNKTQYIKPYPSDTHAYDTISHKRCTYEVNQTSAHPSTSASIS